MIADHDDRQSGAPRLLQGHAIPVARAQIAGDGRVHRGTRDSRAALTVSRSEAASIRRCRRAIVAPDTAGRGARSSRRAGEATGGRDMVRTPGGRLRGRAACRGGTTPRLRVAIGRLLNSHGVETCGSACHATCRSPPSDPSGRSMSLPFLNPAPARTSATRRGALTAPGPPRIFNARCKRRVGSDPVPEGFSS